MEPLTDLGVSVASEVATSWLAKIKKHASYLYKYKDNLKSLEDANVHLDVKRKDASHFSDDAKRRLRDVSDTVSLWQSDADKLLQKAENTISKKNISRLKLWSRYTASKRAWELTQVINTSVKSAPDFGTSFDHPITEGAKFNLRGFTDFDSRIELMNRVLEALKDEDVSMCSICGMGGIGKTTMAKKLVQIVEADGLFGKVAMVTVSQDPNFERIQKEIIELLGLTFEERTMPARAKKLNDWLSNKKTLLILDDVWWQVHDEDFETVGIPLGAKGCKIVVTSRNEDECKKMGSQKNFPLKVLDGEEARDLFIKNAGECDGQLQETAREIVRECDGLPIAIVTVARALKDKTVGVWDDSLRKLQKSNLQAISGMDKVYSRIRLSYDLLNDHEAQSCFRLCCLFPEDYNVPVEKLVFYGKGLELFEGVDSLKEARDRVDSIIDKLKKSFLLLDGEGDEYVRLHDILRDFAISISSKDEYPYFVMCEKEMKKWPETCLFEKCSAISIMCATIKDAIPVGFRCPNLKLLQLFVRDGSGDFPAGFFEGMEELRVVDLEVRSPLPPLTMQKKLRTALIDNGQAFYETQREGLIYFREILGDGNMKNLEIFSLSRTRFSDFPVEIGQLCNLRCLRFFELVSFEYMPTGVLSKLVKLEELKLPLDFNKWGQEEGGGGNRVNAKLNEIETRQLTSINIGVPKGSIFASKNITRFKISIGECRCGLKGIPLDSNFLEFNNVDACDVTANWTHTLVRNCDWLEFVEVRELKCIMFQHELRGNNGFPCTYFSGVKTLIILNMESLEEIWDGPYFPNIQPPCFPNLTKVIIHGCRKLKRVFPFSVSAELRQLQHIEIMSCGEMEEIFYNDQVVDGNQVPKTTETTSTLHSNPNGHKPQLISPQYDASRQILKESIDHVIVLPRLKLLLLRLVSLRVLCNGNHAIECPSLQELNIKQCYDLEAISYGPFKSPETTMRLELKDVRSLENIIKWLHFEQGNKIPRSLTIKRCKKMKYLVDAIADHPNLLKAFFSPLEFLVMEEMDSLEAIWNGPPSNLSNIQPPCFPNLTSIYIWCCPNLTRLFPLSMATQLGQLEHLGIYICHEMEEIFYNNQSMEQHEKEADDAMDAFIFPQLRSLRLLRLSKLRILIDENHAIEFPSLEEFKINGCNKMEALSKGSFIAPKLEAIQINNTMYPCGDDLNTILTENVESNRHTM